ncbi:hypothetical protein [Tsukamurella tyrosinosolvens]|uniref:hypothetical protein n=1 Tax=Tsukamurella tyrosinosolvens TaxID=57704 RepID=UPI002DD45168|nr:hypothetical protein [Tsukamurella tyrosinosolvens]MEC4615825.1 hypothetical protein [Tsukamurella tyrosinosolvens]
MSINELRPLSDWFGDVAFQAARIALIEEDIPTDLLDDPELNTIVVAAARAGAAIALNHHGVDHQEPVPCPWEQLPGIGAAEAFEARAQRVEPNPNLLSLWALRGPFGQPIHVDVSATAVSIRAGSVLLRIRHDDRPAVQEFLREHDQRVFARWRGATYRLALVDAPRAYLDLELEQDRPPSMVGTVTSGLIRTEPARCETAAVSGRCVRSASHPGGHAFPADVANAPTPLRPPMPGDINDLLTQATLRPATDDDVMCTSRQDPWDGYICSRPAGHDGPHAAHTDSSPDALVAIWPQLDHVTDAASTTEEVD